MMKNIFLLFVFIGISANAQVGINTVDIGNSAALYLEAQGFPTTNFGGFLMPVVTEAQQDLIPVSTSTLRDDGLMVYVYDPENSKQCWEIYDAVVKVWRKITCFNVACSSILYQEDFNSYVENTGISGTSNSNGDYPLLVNKWSLSSYSSSRDGSLAYPGTLVTNNDYAFVINGELTIQNAKGPLLFETAVIDIIGYDAIQFSLDIRETGVLEYNTSNHIDDFNCGVTNGNDYVDVLYSTDGGNTFTEVPNYNGLGNSDHTLIGDLVPTETITMSNISGSGLIIQVRAQNYAVSENYFIDNIQVNCN